MSRVVVLAMGLAACVVAGGLLAWHLATPVEGVQGGVTPRPLQSATTPGPSGRCGCTDADCPVCKGTKRWPNMCHARCEGVHDARECADAGDRCRRFGVLGACHTNNETGPLCFDDPPSVVENRECVLVRLGYDDRRGRTCTKAEQDTYFRTEP